MYKYISNLILYSNLAEDSVLKEFSAVSGELERAVISNGFDRATGREVTGLVSADTMAHIDTNALVRRIYVQIKHILDVATDFGFNNNLWRDYLTFRVISDQNSFSLTCEGNGAQEGGSVNDFARNDFRQIMALFHYDFSAIESKLGVSCFSTITDYHAISKESKLYDRHASEIIRSLSDRLAAAKDEYEFFELISDHYKYYGVGMFGLNRAFRIKGSGDTLQFLPINNADPVMLSDLVGYERQKQQLIDNTVAFCSGKRANNVLLYGDAGTGKSSSIKAILNEYCDRGLRMIEIYKHQFADLANVIARIKKRNYKFIIYIDDLSFEENEVEYKFLKAIIEGGVENRPDNILIYATSNRRHLIKETWKDRNDMEHDGDIHRSETMEEKLSLSSRFGIMINYPSPDKQAFNDIVLALAERNGIDMDEEALLAEANKWEIRHGGFSGRTAQQFINYIAGRRQD